MSDGPPLIAVTGSDRPYVFDLPQVLSLPPGFEFRFRYREDWVASAVLDALERDRSGLAGRPLWLFFHSRSTERLLPLRLCTVVRLERLGPVIFLRFRVDEFPKFDSIKISSNPTGTSNPASPIDPEHERHTCAVCVQGGALSESARDLILGTKQPLSDSLPKRSYLAFGKNTGEAFAWSRTTDRPFERPETTARRWGQTVELLSHGEPELVGVPLFYLLGFQDKDGNWEQAVALDKKSTALATYGYQLTKDERYRMRVIEWRKDRPDHSLVKINCVFDPHVLSLEGSWDMVVGKYDVPEFTFTALRRGYSEVGIATDPLPSVLPDVNPAPELDPIPGIQAKPTVRRDAWPRYYSARVPVQVLLGWWNWIKTISLVTLGVLMFALPQLGWVQFFSSGTGRSAAELVGLLLLVTGGGNFARDYAQLGGALFRLPWFTHGQSNPPTP